MGNRLSKIYTKTGDDGSTGLSDGSRLNKFDIRIHCLGEVDELNSFVGLVMSESLPEAAKNDLKHIQHLLFNLGGELATPGFSLINDEHISWLEQRLDNYNDDLQPLKEFILPGGSKAATYTHLARAISRRAERCVCHLNNLLEEDKKHLHCQQFLNRLSDYLFTLARHLNHSFGVNDVLWQNPTKS